jgi:spore germination protein YaaH
MSFQPYYYAYNVKTKKNSWWRFLSSFVFLSLIIFALILNQFLPLQKVLFQNPSSLTPLSSSSTKGTHEVFGFGPYWTLNKLGNVDFSVLTTFAYFGIPVNSDGSLNTDDIGYKKFYSPQATAVFKEAHANGTRVVATFTQTDNATIKDLMDDNRAQKEAIKNAVNLVSERGLDGINVDFEYVGNPGEEYKEKFSNFVKNLTLAMHKAVPSSKVTVSVYASSVIDPKLYDIKALSANSDGIFMMAYDFATSSSDKAMPTDPLYGYKDGKYWYDISTAVDDFLTQMPKDKLILGLPWYGYDYPVTSPADNAPKDYGYYTYYWRYGYKHVYFVPRDGAHASTYALTQSSITPDEEGWDNEGEVGWKAYQTADGWRMVFIDDEKSLGIKYDFAKDKGLGGVGMWALGFDDDSTSLWQLLESKFGQKYVDNSIRKRPIYEI